MNNNYSHIITGEVNNDKKGGFVNSYPKVQSMENQEKSVFKNLFNCKYFYVLTILRKLNFDCQIPCYTDNSTEAFIKIKLKFK